MRRINRIPPSSAERRGAGPPASTTAAATPDGRNASTHANAAAKSATATANTVTGLIAKIRPPSAGPVTTAICDAIERSAIALARCSVGTSDGGIARCAGEPIAAEIPVRRRARCTARARALRRP